MVSEKVSLAETLLERLYGLQFVYTQRKVPEGKTYHVAQRGSFCHFLALHPIHARISEVSCLHAELHVSTDGHDHSSILQQSSVEDRRTNCSESTQKGIMGNLSLPEDFRDL